MGQIVHGQRTEASPEEDQTFAQDLEGMGISFGKAVGEAVSNVFGGLEIVSFEASEEVKDAPLIASIKKTFSPLSAYSFMAFVLLYMPCMVTAAAFKHELGSWKWFGLACAWGLATAWVTSFLIYQVGSLIGVGTQPCI
jgi:ferrous iron transport protein B